MVVGGWFLLGTRLSGGFPPVVVDVVVDVSVGRDLHGSRLVVGRCRCRCRWGSISNG